jgi:hypothetical protein
MQIQRHNLKDHYHRRVSCLMAPVLLVTVVFTLSFLFANKPSSPDTTRSTATMTDSTSTESRIYYKLKEEDVYQGSKYRKYAAYSSDNHQPVSIQSWIQLHVSNVAESSSLTQLIKDCPYEAVFFETQGVSSANASEKHFEFVLMDAPQLKSFAESSPDPNAFAEPFRNCPTSKPTCSFPNIGGDAQLIAPRPSTSSPASNSSHLAVYCRTASTNQVEHFWNLAAQEYQQRLASSSRTVWVSTSGLGIAWLHLRLDSRPKYYQYMPFAREV